MARADEPDSANSQFFIMFYPRFALDQNYTNFGRVIASMDAVDAIDRGEPPADPTRIVQASIASDHKPQKFPPASPPAQASVPRFDSRRGGRWRQLAAHLSRSRGDIGDFLR